MKGDTIERRCPEIAENIYIYHTSPNQKSIVTRKTLSDAEHKYGKCNIEATLTAAKELTDRAFKLYIRMNLHQDGFAYALSPVEIKSSIGMSGNKYHEAVKELIKKGYLVQSDKHKSLYYFYEFPKKEYQDNIADTATTSIGFDDMVGKYPIDNFGSSDKEIGLTITSHTTEDTTGYNCALDENKGRDYQSFLQEYNSYFQMKQKQDTPLEIPEMDPLYTGPGSNADNTDWENDDLPF